MSERVFMVVFGITLLVALYFGLETVMYTLVTLLIFEGITNLRLSRLRVPLFVQRETDERIIKTPPSATRFNLEALRAWRLMMAVALTLSIIYHDQVWFLAWFMGFTVAGAGLSGVCPVLLMLYRLGFK